MMELWWNGMLADAQPHEGDMNAVAAVIAFMKSDYAELQKECAPGVNLAPQSITVWF